MLQVYHQDRILIISHRNSFWNWPFNCSLLMVPVNGCNYPDNWRAPSSDELVGWPASATKHTILFWKSDASILIILWRMWSKEIYWCFVPTKEKFWLWQVWQRGGDHGGLGCWRKDSLGKVILDTFLKVIEHLILFWRWLVTWYFSHWHWCHWTNGQVDTFSPRYQLRDLWHGEDLQEVEVRKTCTKKVGK